MASLLSPGQIKELEAVFAAYDTSGEGLIDHKELGVMLRAMGLFCTEAEVQDMIVLVDSDGSGKLDFPEFLNLMTSRLKDTDLEAEESDSFARFDGDKDGKISISDLKQLCASLDETVSVEDLKEMIKEASMGGDSLSKDQFHLLLQTN